ncbi:uncharacterized protein LOC134830003 [Culicoides brevitarsis]|uniref:uncharacterized protein LOC134830003 n=1 Tax=Culicoides brevitarsis TaxID=469753 RepID=UPI00307B9301
MNKIMSRGAFIVFEGCDRSGKTTQSVMLVETLKKLGYKAMYMNFPDRTTKTGKEIDEYLNKKKNYTDEEIHYLFSRNRWEVKELMENRLLNGTTLIVDRYSFSGVAFTAAKGLDIEWCKAPEIGLMKPDLVVYMTLPLKEIVSRGGFGKERYEIPEFQRRVGATFKKLFDPTYWKEVDASPKPEELQITLTNIVENAIEDAKDKPLSYLW